MNSDDSQSSNMQKALGGHMFAHAVRQNSNLMMPYNINSDAMFQMHTAHQFGFNNYPVYRSPYVNTTPRVESRNIEAPTAVPKVDFICKSTRSPRNNQNQRSGSLRRNGYVSYCQGSIVPYPLSRNMDNKTKSHEPVDLGIASNSKKNQRRNRGSSEPGNDCKALDLSLKPIYSVPMMKAGRVGNVNPTAAANSNNSGQTGHFKSVRRKRKGVPFKLDQYLKEDDTPPASPS